MKKKLAPALVVVLLVAIVSVVVVARSKQQGYVTEILGNHERQPVEVVFDHYQCPGCGMLLRQLRDSAQAIDSDGRTIFFDDVGCLARWLEEQEDEDLILWVHTRDTEEWTDGRTAQYSRDDVTPMRYGFAAYHNEKEGFISFDEMSLKMLRGENLTNPYVKKELLGGA